MTPLHDSLRKLLEKTVIQARDLAEEGAQAALEQLGVGILLAISRSRIGSCGCSCGHGRDSWEIRW